MDAKRAVLPKLPEPVMTAARTVLARTLIDPESPVGVTSVARGDGRTTLALALATVLGVERGRTAVLVELDREQPSWPGAVGLADVLTGDADLSEALLWPHPHVAVLPIGRSSAVGEDVSRLFAGSGVLAALAAQDMIVVADLPPLPPNGEGDRVAGLFKVVLLVVRAGRTTSAGVRVAAATLDQPPLVVLNRMVSAVPGWLNLSWRT